MFQNIFKNAEKAEELFKLNPEFFTSLNPSITNSKKTCRICYEWKFSYINWVK